MGGAIIVSVLVAGVVFMVRRDDAGVPVGDKSEPPKTVPPKTVPPKTALPKTAPPKKELPKKEPLALEVSHRLNAIMRGAGADDWGTVETEFKALRSSLIAPRTGNRELASALKSEGLKSLEQKDYKKAIQRFSSAVEADPGDASLHGSLGRAFLRDKNFDAAEQNISKSLSIAPALGAAWLVMAEILAEKDNSIAAKAALKVAIRLNSNRQGALDYLTREQEISPSKKFAAVISQALPGVNAIPSAPLELK